MATFYYESGNRYTDPVRYFKANDPYYYEVDNIPIKQLEENSRFLKDQVDGLINEVKGASVDRSNFSELQPYTDGVDSTIKVRPGRFTARINEAYTKDPLQFIEKVLGQGDNTDPIRDSWTVGTVASGSVSAALVKWRTKVVDNATNMNGLFERTFVYPMKSNDFVGEGVNSENPNSMSQSTTGNISGRASWPGLFGYLHEYNTNRSTRPVGMPDGTTIVDLFRQAGRLESEFIKRWRGAIRTSIVDIPNELQIEIPRFSDEDFFYYDESGNRIPLSADQRIDLLFIYSKPIDQSEIKVASYTNGVPRTLTTPELGIVKGAGLGISLQKSTTAANRDDNIRLQSLDGVPLMVANSSDELAENTGVSGSAGVIRGSFPSPDDLMNLAPLLSENLSTTSVALIGQSILPIAYIVVRRGAELNERSTPIIENSDIIDIRPFFRTTELTYNERAGIAAATPQLSIANPVVTEGTLDDVRSDLVIDYNTKINNLRGEIGQSRIIGAGMIKGGMLYGVEGALATYLRDTQGVTDYETAKTRVKELYDYKGDIPDLPDWDLSRWAEAANYEDKGKQPNDRINWFHWGNGGRQSADQEELKYSCLKYKPANMDNLQTPFSEGARVGRIAAGKLWRGLNNLGGSNDTLRNGEITFHFCSKTINIDRSNVESWAYDYHVAVQLHHCLPTTCRGYITSTQNDPGGVAGASQIWVEKRRDSFTIFVAWVGDDTTQPKDYNNVWNNVFANQPAQNRDDGSKFSGWLVLNKDIMSAPNPNGSFTGIGTEAVTAGVAIYPTVSFQIFGIPNDISSEASNLNGIQPTIVLR